MNLLELMLKNMNENYFFIISGGYMLKKSSIRIKFFFFLLVIFVPLILIFTYNNLQDHKRWVQTILYNCECLSEAVSNSFMNYINQIWIMDNMVDAYVNENSELSKYEIERYLRSIKEKHNGITSINLLSVDGKGIASSNGTPDQELIDFIMKNYSINDSKNRVISYYTKNESGNKKLFMVSMSMLKNDEKTTGIITTVLDINYLYSRLPHFENMSCYMLSIIDNNGVLITFNDNEKMQDKVIDLSKNTSVTKAIHGVLSKGEKEKSDVEEVFVTYVDYPISEIGWDCRVSVPYDLIVTYRYKKITTDLLLLALIMAVSVILIRIFDYSLIKSASALSSAAKKIMKGDYTARTNIKGGDEIGLAAEAFDKMAKSVEEWYESKTQYFTNISHEIKTPINVIFASVQLVEAYNKLELPQEIYKQKIMKQIKVIRQNCFRSIRLISNLTDISRYDSGYLNIKLNNYDIVKLIREITFSVQRYAEAKGIDLVFDSLLPSKIIACDPDMIERIILNLISNAIKFTAKDGTIKISINEYEDKLIISVKDTGTGIPKDKLNDIFDRFKKADDNNNLNKEGTGIGLYLVKAFVNAHGGDISVSSESMKGTEFIINIPVTIIENNLDKKQQIFMEQSKESQNLVSRTSIELSDIYSCLDENIS